MIDVELGEPGSKRLTDYVVWIHNTVQQHELSLAKQMIGLTDHDRKLKELDQNMKTLDKYLHQKVDDHTEYLFNAFDRTVTAMRYEIEERFDTLSGLYKETSDKVDSLHTEMNQRFEAVHTEMNQRFEAVHTEMDERFKGVHTEMDERFKGVHAEMNQRFEAVDGKIDSVREELGSVRGELGSMQDQLRAIAEAVGA